MVKKVGQYELTTILGKGTFGTVYLGKHIPSKKKVAVKVICKKTLKPELMSRLEQEILCQKSVSSENIVKLIEVQKTENNFYLILEYCEGGDLGNFLKKNGPVAEDIARRWIQQIIEGFKVLQEKSIIHRDLKTQNILLTEESFSAVLKLADFGLSRFIDDDLAKTWVGTPLYMAPEIFNCEEYGPKADIWSLGLVFYEMLTGELPIKVQKREQIPSAQRSLKPMPSSISVQGQEFLLRLLEYDHKKRISFQELFNHPYIISRTNNVVIDEELSDEEFEDEDFILLERDESINDNLVLSKLESPEINYLDVVNSICKDLELGKIFEKIVEKLTNNQNFFFAFAVSVEATLVLEKRILHCKEICSKSQGNVQNLDFEKSFERLKKFFKEFLEKSEGLNKLQSEAKKELSIEEFLQGYAIDLCKKAAENEYLCDYDASKAKYQEAVLILEYLNKTYCEEGSNENKKIESFLSETNIRVQNVNVHISSF